MRVLLYVFTIAGVMALAFWAYDENHQTKEALDKVETLHRKIADTRARVGVLHAEWAYLNRPERLRDLAELNFEKLGLLPLAPEQFGRVEEVAFPAPELPVLGPITNPVEVSSQ